MAAWWPSIASRSASDAVARSLSRLTAPRNSIESSVKRASRFCWARVVSASAARRSIKVALVAAVA